MIPAADIQGVAYFGNRILVCEACGENHVVPLLSDP
jgi:hypothetical protein